MPASSRPTDEVGTLTVRVVQAAQSELEGRELIVGAQALWVGRGNDCDLVVSDPSVSRRHATLEVDPGGILVTDNGSANGVLVDGRRIDGPIVVAPGGQFTLGGIVMAVLAPEVETDSDDGFPIDRTVSLSSVVDLVRQLGAQRPLEELGDSAVVAANRPFLINDPDTAWLVVSGKLELFTVRVENGQPTGTRTHFLSL